MDGDDFCPECQTLLVPIETVEETDEKSEKEDNQKVLLLRCDDCGFNRMAKSFSTTHFSKHVNKIESTLNMDPARVADLLYVKTYPVTQQLACVNKECPSRSGPNPPIHLITSDKFPERGYICSICKYRWGRF